MLRPDALAVWEYPEVVERLSWYREVMMDRLPAKFMVARRLEVQENPYEIPEESELWRLHDRASSEFSRVLREIREGAEKFEKLEEPRHSYLDLKIALSKKMADPCRLCERRCGARRLGGKMGSCMASDKAIVHSAFLHIGEEAPLVPSGTIFYGGCNFRCVFCQNYDISQVNATKGVALDARQLAELQERLRKEGARNINHVGGEPTPYIPLILESFKFLRVNVPQLWNSNMYMSEGAARLLLDVIDIWLPDLKYGNDQCAWKYSMVKNYWEVATRNIKMAHDSGGDMIIRHLVMPNHVDCCTRPVLEWISKNAKRALVNVMDQYRPEYLVLKYPNRFREIARRPRQEEILAAYKIAEELGIVYRPVS